MNLYFALGMICFAFVAGCWAGFGMGGDHMARMIERSRTSHRERADG